MPIKITKFDPKLAINMPPKNVPMVVPEFTADRKIPFDKSGASGATEIMTYCVIFAEIPASIPQSTEIIIIGIKNEPIPNMAT